MSSACIQGEEDANDFAVALGHCADYPQGGAAMKHVTVEMWDDGGDRWHWYVRMGQPSPTLWANAETRWFRNRAGFSFSIYAPRGIISPEMVENVVNRFLTPRTDTLAVDLRVFAL